MGNRIRTLLVLFVLIFSMGCASLSVNPKTDESQGKGSSWDTDDYQNPNWIDMHGY